MVNSSFIRSDVGSTLSLNSESFYSSSASYDCHIHFEIGLAINLLIHVAIWLLSTGVIYGCENSAKYWMLLQG